MPPRTFLSRFRSLAPRHSLPQDRGLAWLAAAHAEAECAATVPPGDREASLTRFAALVARYGCGPEQIAARGHELPDFQSTDWERAEVFRLHEDPRGASFAARTDFFAKAAERMLGEAYAADARPPAHLIHVTCTGYAAPSAAQLLVARRAWPTVVTHAYHMGCAGAFPAVRMAAAFAARLGDEPGVEPRVDVVHTELCTLHLDPTDHSPEQLVAQGLFADGGIAYAATTAPPPGAPSLELVAARELLVPGAEDAMTWKPGTASMRMTLSRRMPALVREHLRPFLEALLHDAGADAAAARGAVFAIHPGGPKIIDAALEAMDLSERQVAWSRRVLLEHGNMSSATIPHVWQAIVEDESVPPGTLVPSVAFGPGLTVSGAVFRKA